MVAMNWSRLVLYSLVIVLLGSALCPAEPLSAKGSAEDLDKVLQFERAWCNAYLHADIDFLRTHVARDFTLTGSDGHIDTLAGDIADLQRGTVKYSVFENREMKPRIYGDTAVVTGWTKVKATIEGKPYETDVAFTDTLVRLDGQWFGVAGHVSKPPKK